MIALVVAVLKFVISWQFWVGVVVGDFLIGPSTLLRWVSDFWDFIRSRV